jgi:hypothetical protein
MYYSTIWSSQIADNISGKILHKLRIGLLESSEYGAIVSTHRHAGFVETARLRILIWSATLFIVSGSAKNR